MKCMFIDKIPFVGLWVFPSGDRYAVEIPNAGTLAYVSEESLTVMKERGHTVSVKLTKVPNGATIYKDVPANTKATFITKCDFTVENGEIWLIPELSQNSDKLILTADFWTGEDRTGHFLGDMERLATVCDQTSGRTYHLLRLARDSGVVSIDKRLNRLLKRGAFLDYRLFYFEDGRMVAG